MLAFSILAWLACAGFIIIATYVHYGMNSNKDVTPLILGAWLSGAGGCYLINEIINGKKT
jgi:hypothetical protein